MFALLVTLYEAFKAAKGFLGYAALPLKAISLLWEYLFFPVAEAVYRNLTWAEIERAFMFGLLLFTYTVSFTQAAFAGIAGVLATVVSLLVKYIQKAPAAK